MSLGNNGIDPDVVRSRAAELNGEPVHQGTYSAQSVGNSLYGCLPDGFVNHFGLQSQSEIEVYVDYQLGCALIFPSEVLADG